MPSSPSKVSAVVRNPNPEIKPSLKLAGVAFRHEHIFDASKAPRGQLPCIIDDGQTIGDSETIIAHATAKYRLTIDAALSDAQRRTNLLVTWSRGCSTTCTG